MSLAEAQEIYEIFQKIDTILNGIEVKVSNLKTAVPQTEESIMTLQEGTRILFRFNHILAHLGLPENVNSAIRQLQQLVFMARMVEMSFSFLAMGSPYGTIMGILGIGSVAVSLGAFTEPMMAMGEP